MVWKKARKGAGARLLWGYLAVAVIFAITSPGMAVFAADAPAPEPSAPAPIVEPAPVVEPVVVEPAPVEEPVVVEPAPVEEPVVVEPAPVEEPVVVEPAPVEEPVVVEPVKADPATAPVEQPLVAASVVIDPETVPASGQGITPTLVDGNPTCSDPDHLEYKIEGIPGNGTYTLPDGSTITISNATNYSFDYTSTGILIHEVIVKASNAANVYTYGDPGVTWDTGLWTVPKPTSGWYDISHVSFCYTLKPVERTGSIVVYKFMDDGTHEWPGDGPMEGVEFILKDGDGIQIDSGFTGADGTLTFSDLPMGDYTVEEVVPDGWQNTTGLTVPVTLTDEGQEEIVGSAYFGNERDVFTKTFELTYPDKPAAVDELLVSFDLNGVSQELTLVLDGDVYTASVQVEYPYEITNVVWWAHTADGLFALSEAYDDVTLTGDLTNYYTYAPSISGHKFNDLDGNGIWGEEPALAGWTIYLYRLPEVELQDAYTPPAGAVLVAQTVTDANGYYEFTGMLPGSYYVVEKQELDWTPTVWPTTTIVVVHDTDATDLDFGNHEEFVPFTELDLAITKLANVEEADPGDVITYTLTYWNNGEIPATNFTIVDDYDERYVTVVDAAGGSVSGGKITWTLPGPLAMADGPKTIVFTMRVIDEMPEGTTNVDNVVVISHPRDSNPTNNTDDERVIVKEPFLPFTPEEEPFLPFTGGEYLVLLGTALATAAAGLVLRVRASRAE